MIKQIIELLQADDWHGVKSEAIEIAKGKYEQPATWKGIVAKARRIWSKK